MTICKLLGVKSEAMKSLKWLTKASKQDYVDAWFCIDDIRRKEKQGTNKIIFEDL